MPSEVIKRLLEHQEQDWEGEHEFRNLCEGEVSQEADTPVMALHEGVGHWDEVVAPR